MAEQSGRCSILLVDPDPRSLRILEVSLAKAGFQVIPANDGSAALALFEAHKPQLVLTDTKLPELDGFDLCQRIKLRSDVSDVQVVLLSSEAGRDAHVRALQMGADDFIPRPAYTREVVTRVKMLLHRRARATMTANDSPERMAADLADVSIVDAIQMVESVQRSGIINLTDPDGRRGAVYFRQGRIVDAEVGRLSGADAFYRLLSWQDGRFEIEWKTVRRNDVIQQPTSTLLLEGMRRLEEWTRLTSVLPSLKTAFEVDYRALADRLAEIPDEANGVLRLLDGRRTFLQVIDECPFSDLEAVSTIGRLFAEGIIYDSRTRSGDSGGVAVPTPGWYTESSGRLLPADLFEPPAPTPLRTLPGTGRAQTDSGQLPHAAPSPTSSPGEPAAATWNHESTASGSSEQSPAGSAQPDGLGALLSSSVPNDPTAAADSASGESALESPVQGLPSVASAHEEPTPVLTPESAPEDDAAGNGSAASPPLGAAATAERPTPEPAPAQRAPEPVSAPQSPPELSTPSSSDRPTPVRLIIDLPVATPPLGTPVHSLLPSGMDASSAVPRPRSEGSGNVMRFGPQPSARDPGPRAGKETRPTVTSPDLDDGPRSLKQTIVGLPLDRLALAEQRVAPRNRTPAQGSPVLRPIIALTRKRSAVTSTSPGLGTALAARAEEPAPTEQDEVGRDSQRRESAATASEPVSVAGPPPQDVPASGDIEVHRSARPALDEFGDPAVRAAGTVVVTEEGAYTLPYDEAPPHEEEDLATVEARQRRHRFGVALGVVLVAAAGTGLGLWLLRARPATSTGAAAGASAAVATTAPAQGNEPISGRRVPASEQESSSPPAPAGASVPPVAAAGSTTAAASTVAPTTAAPTAPATEPGAASRTQSQPAGAPAIAAPAPGSAGPRSPAPASAASRQPTPAESAEDLLGPCQQAVAAERARAADKACGALINADPENPRSMSLVAQASLLSGRYKAALRWARQATERDPGQSEAWAVIGIAEQQNGNRDAARSAYQRYLELAPNGKLAGDIRSALDGL